MSSKMYKRGQEKNLFFRVHVASKCKTYNTHREYVFYMNRKCSSFVGMFHLWIFASFPDIIQIFIKIGIETHGHTISLCLMLHH